jgi:hypothetical protein
MSKEKGPPRPGARPRPTGRSPSGVHRAGRPTANRTTPPDSPTPVEPPKPEAPQPTGEALEMIPIGQDAPADPGGDGATTFFARPKPKGSNASAERPAEPPKLQGHRPPMVGAPPPMPNAPTGIPMGRPPMGGGSLGIQGPVASGPMASGSSVPVAASSAGGPPDGNTQRTRSFRLYAFVLLICTGLAGSLVVGLGLIVMATQSESTEKQAVEALPKPTPSPRPRANADTATPKKPKPAPRNTARPSPRPTAAPRPTPKPAPAPAPVAVTRPAPVASSGGGTVTLTFASAPSFLRAEMRCPGGERQRKSFSGTRVTFDKVASSGCTVTLKGGAAHAPIEVVGGRNMTCEEKAGLPDCR